MEEMKEFLETVKSGSANAITIAKQALDGGEGKIKHREGAYVIVTDIDKKLPKKPSGVTAAMVSDGDDGKDTLFCQKGGTHKGNAKQSMLCQENGSPLQEQPETQE